MFKKLKSLLITDQWFYGALLLLVGVVSFLLGQASVPESVPMDASLSPKVTERTSISPIPQADLPEAETAVATSVVAVVASKSGTKYHLPTCPGAKQIKEENKLFFATIAAAEAAGYKRAANCPEVP